MDPDLEVRLAAFNWLRDQMEIHGDVLPRELLQLPVFQSSIAQFRFYHFEFWRRFRVPLIRIFRTCLHRFNY